MKKVIALKGLDCMVCAERILERVRALAAVSDASIDLAGQKLTVVADGGQPHELLVREIADIVAHIEPKARVLDAPEEHAGEENRFDRGRIVQLIAGLALLVAALISGEGTWHKQALFVASYVVIGARVLWQAIRNISRGQVFDENFLMTIASLGAMIIGEQAEGIAVMLFYQVGELFQEAAIDRSRRSIARLMDIRPDSASVLRDGAYVDVAPEQVRVGEVMRVRAGERIALDGVVESGSGELDTSALTGESAARFARPGDEVLSGFISAGALLHIRATRAYGESAVSRILDMVENAALKKAKREQFITRFARVYTPLVVALAALLAVLPPLIIPGAEFSQWVYRALVFLVISCPCALVISVPLGFFAGIGAFSRNGVLVKGGNYLEALTEVRTIVFDKTGTLTEGKFSVRGAHPAAGIDERALLKWAAYAEHQSNHPIAQSIRRAYPEPIDESLIAGVREIAGKGVEATVEGRRVLAGNDALMALEGIEGIERDARGTLVHVALDGRYIGYISIEDGVKPGAAEAIAALREQGVDELVMLSGDRESAVMRVKQELGLDDARAELLPDQKVEYIERLLKAGGGKVAFVGDGINDAPSLMRADVGLAMGALGSDAAIEAADVVIMDDALIRIPLALRVARRTMRIVKQNIALSLGVKLLVLALGAIGLASMWAAVFADVGVSVLAILNSLRALRAGRS